jgi:hypothetical protein
MPHSYLIAVSKPAGLFPVSLEIKNALYIVNTDYISCGGGDNPLSGRHFIPL